MGVLKPKSAIRGVLYFLGMGLPNIFILALEKVIGGMANSNAAVGFRGGLCKLCSLQLEVCSPFSCSPHLRSQVLVLSFSITILLPLSFSTYIVLIPRDQIGYHFLHDLDKQVATDYYSFLKFHDFKKHFPIVFVAFIIHSFK